MSHLSKKIITLKGLIVPSQWDQKGNVTGIAIACFDEKEYEIIMDDVGDGLIAFLHRRVRIVGQRTKKERAKTIKVKEFSPND